MFSIFPLLIVILFSMLMYEYKMSIVAVFCPLHSTLHSTITTTIETIDGGFNGIYLLF